MIRDQSWFWSIPGLFVAVACTVVIVIHPVPQGVAYGIGTFIYLRAFHGLTDLRMGSSLCMGGYLGRHHRTVGSIRIGKGEKELGR
jgi:hypothetical protein